MQKNIIIAIQGQTVLHFSSIQKLCRHFGWNYAVFRNALSESYKKTGKRAVEFRGWKVEKRPF